MVNRRVDVEWTETANQSLLEIGDRAIQRKIVAKVDRAAASGTPELLGKALQNELMGLYRMSFGRYRIVYRVVRDSNAPNLVRIIVRVVLTGLRKEGDKLDIYERLRRLVRLGRA